MRLHNVRITVSAFVSGRSVTPSASLSTGQRSGGWTEVLDSLTPAHCNLMSIQQKLAVLQLSKLDHAFKSVIPPRLFSMVVHSISHDASGLQSWAPAQLASLLGFSRAAGLHLQRDTASFVARIEEHLIDTDLSSLPLSVVTDVFKSYLSDLAGHSAAATALAAELGRRATTLAAHAPGGSLPSVSTSISATPDSLPVAQSLPERTGTLSTGSSDRPALGSSQLTELSTMGEVVAAVEKATAAVLSVTLALPSSGTGLGSAQARAAGLVRAQESIAAFRALAIADLLRRAESQSHAEESGRMAAGSRRAADDTSSSAPPSMSAHGSSSSSSVPPHSSQGSGSGKGGSGSGSSRSRNDWRKRLTDGTLVAAGVGAVLAVGAVATGLQAAQAPAPSHRLVALLEKASPGTMIHLLQYVIGPLPSLYDLSTVPAPVSTGPVPGGPTRGAGGVASFTRNVTGLLKADAEQRVRQRAEEGAVDSDSAAMRMLRSLWTQSERPGAPSEAEGGARRSSSDDHTAASPVPTVPSPAVVGAGIDGAATATVIAAARRALSMTGLEGYSCAQLCALVELLGTDAAVTVGAGEGQSGTAPSPFWEAVLRAASSHPVSSFTVGQRLSLAHRLCRVSKGVGGGLSGPGRQGAEYSKKAGELIASVVAERESVDALVHALVSHPALITRLAHVATMVPTEYLSYLPDGSSSSSTGSSTSSSSTALGRLSTGVAQAVHALGAEYVEAQSASSLWTILSLYERSLACEQQPAVLAPHADGHAFNPSSCQGGGPQTLAECLVRKFSAQAFAAASPLLTMQLLAHRSQGMRRQSQGREEPGSTNAVVSVWQFIPSTYVDGLWTGLLPILDSAPARSPVPAPVPRPGSSISSSSPASAAGHNSTLAEQVSPTLKARSAGRALMVAAYGRQRAELRGVESLQQPSPPIEGAAHPHPASSVSEAVRAAVLARAPHLLLTACEQLDIPAARQAVSILSEVCASSDSAAQGSTHQAATVSDAQSTPSSNDTQKAAASRRVDLARHSFALMHAASAVQLLGQAAQRPQNQPAADLAIAYGRLLSMLSRSMSSSGLACEPAASGRTSGERDVHIGNTSINTLITLWSKLLDCESHLASATATSTSSSSSSALTSGSGPGSDQGVAQQRAGLALTAWNPVTVSALRTAIVLACINISGELAHRLSARAQGSAGGDLALPQQKQASVLGTTLRKLAGSARSAATPRASIAVGSEPSLSPYLLTTLLSCLQRTQELPASVLSSAPAGGVSDGSGGDGSDAHMHLLLDRDDDMSSHNAALAARHSSSSVGWAVGDRDEGKVDLAIVARRSQRLVGHLASLHEAVDAVRHGHLEEETWRARQTARTDSTGAQLLQGKHPRSSGLVNGKRLHSNDDDSGDDVGSSESSTHAAAATAGAHSAGRESYLPPPAGVPGAGVVGSVGLQVQVAATAGLRHMV